VPILDPSQSIYPLSKEAKKVSALVEKDHHIRNNIQVKNYGCILFAAQIANLH
jgi:hypothetical protein